MQCQGYEIVSPSLIQYGVVYPCRHRTKVSERNSEAGLLQITHGTRATDGICNTWPAVGMFHHTYKLEPCQLPRKALLQSTEHSYGRIFTCQDLRYPVRKSSRDGQWRLEYTWPIHRARARGYDRWRTLRASHIDSTDKPPAADLPSHLKILTDPDAIRQMAVERYSCCIIRSCAALHIARG